MYGAPTSDAPSWSASTHPENVAVSSSSVGAMGMYAPMSAPGAPGAPSLPAVPFAAQRPPHLAPDTSFLGDARTARYAGLHTNTPPNNAPEAPSGAVPPGGALGTPPQLSDTTPLAPRAPRAGAPSVRPPGTGPRRGRPPRNPRPPVDAGAAPAYVPRPTPPAGSFTPALSPQQQQALMARAVQLSKAQDQPTYTPLHALLQMGFVFVRNTQLPNVPPSAAQGGTILRADEAAALGLLPPQAAAAGMRATPWQPPSLPLARPTGMEVRPGVARPDTASASVPRAMLPGAPTNVPLVKGGAPPARSAAGLPITLQNTRLTPLPPATTQPYPWTKLSEEDTRTLRAIMDKDAAFQPALHTQQKRTEEELYAHAAPLLHPTPPSVAPRAVPWFAKSVHEPAAPRTAEPLKLVLPAQRQRALEQGVRGVRAPVPLTGAELARTVNQTEMLVPIRLELDHEPFKLRDTFTWNAAEDDASLEAFAVALCEDLGLPTAVFVPMIRTAIQAQVSEYAAAMALQPEPSVHALPEDAAAHARAGRGTLTEAGTHVWRRLRARVLGHAEAVETAEEAAVFQGETNEDFLEKEPASDPPTETAQPPRAEGTPPAGLGAPAPPSGEAAPCFERLPGEERQAEHAASSLAAPTESAPGAGPSTAPGAGRVRGATPPCDHGEELRVLIKLDILVGAQNLVDQFEWDLLDQDTQSAERFAETFAAELGLPGEFKTAIVHAIREQVSTHLRLLFVLGYPFNRLTSMDEEVRTVFLPTLAPEALARRHGEVDAFTPKLVQLTPADALHLEREHEREMRRKRRQTKGRRGINLAEREPQRTIRSVPVYGLQGGLPDASTAAPHSRRAAAAAASAQMTAAHQDAPDETPAPAPKRVRTDRHELHFRYPGGLGAPGRPALPRFRSQALAQTPLDALGRRVPVAAPVPTEATPRGRLPKERPPASDALQRTARPEDLERQHPNMFDGVWHCANCGLPGYLAPGRRKGPAGEKTLCGPCGKYYHRHRRMESVTYTRDPAYHIKRLKRMGHAPGESDAPEYSAAQDAHAPLPLLPEESDSEGDPGAPVPPAWLVHAAEASRRKYPNDCFQIQLRPQMPDAPPPVEEEWRIRCADCPGKVYKPGPGESLINFEIHLKNRSHRAAVARRLGNVGG